MCICKQPPKLAICLAAYNGKRWLKTQIESILAQRGVNVTIFISVDCSGDGTESFINSFAKADERIVILPHGQRFGSAACNFFRLLKDVDFGGFDYVSLADQDDIWFADKLARAVNCIVDLDVDCYSGNVIAVWNDGTSVLVDKAQKQCEWDFLFESAGPGCTYVFRYSFAKAVQSRIKQWPYELIQKVGLHDWFIYAFARALGYRWFIDPQPYMYYRQHLHNQVGANSGFAAFRARAGKILSGWGVSQARLIARLVGLGDCAFCRPWAHPGRIGMLWLAINSRKTRRKVSDKCVFAIVCCVLFVIGDRSDV